MKTPSLPFFTVCTPKYTLPRCALLFSLPPRVFLAPHTHTHVPARSASASVATSDQRCLVTVPAEHGLPPGTPFVGSFEPAAGACPGRDDIWVTLEGSPYQVRHGQPPASSAMMQFRFPTLSSWDTRRVHTMRTRRIVVQVMS